MRTRTTRSCARSRTTGPWDAWPGPARRRRSTRCSPRRLDRRRRRRDSSRRMTLNAYNQIASRGLDRIAALSDGVFAVALTLLVLDIRLPDGAVIDSDSALLQALGALGPRIVPYLLSFMTIGIFWN